MRNVGKEREGGRMEKEEGGPSRGGEGGGWSCGNESGEGGEEDGAVEMSREERERRKKGSGRVRR